MGVEAISRALGTGTGEQDACHLSVRGKILPRTAAWMRNLWAIRWLICRCQRFLARIMQSNTGWTRETVDRVAAGKPWQGIAPQSAGDGRSGEICWGRHMNFWCLPPPTPRPRLGAAYGCTMSKLLSRELIFHPRGGGCAGRAVSRALASVVASGTATVESALIGNPFIAVYRLSSFSYAVASPPPPPRDLGWGNLPAMVSGVCPQLVKNPFLKKFPPRVEFPGGGKLVSPPGRFFCFFLFFF